MMTEHERVLRRDSQTARAGCMLQGILAAKLLLRRVVACHSADERRTTTRLCLSIACCSFVMEGRRQPENQAARNDASN